MAFVKKKGYISLGHPDEEEIKDDVKHTTVEIGLSSVVTIVVVLLLSIASMWAIFVQNMIYWNVVPTTPATTIAITSGCFSPPIRREWRTLNTAAKNDYISAVQCLATKPSKLRRDGTLYDDFPWLHQKTAPTAHMAASFFPWHRYFIHVYEDALKTECGYQGLLPYWDWSADADDFENASVWDAHSGFGGNGAGAAAVGEGRCVTDGPFANLDARFYGDKYQPHCLSRGFSTGAELEKLSSLVKPAVIENIMEEADFKTFAQRLEHNAHKFVSGSIRGDFSKYTGSYDPVFFLHHANLDRLWWEWQQQDLPNRALAYDGPAPKAAVVSTVKLTDMLDVGELKRSVPVKDVMDTQNELFCYQY